MITHSFIAQQEYIVDASKIHTFLRKNVFSNTRNNIFFKVIIFTEQDIYFIVLKLTF